MSPRLAAVPGIPNSPDLYAKAHPDRVEKFPSSKKRLIDPEEIFFDPRDLIDDNGSHSVFRHELSHDAESVFWLLLYWAMVVQPENSLKEDINAPGWSLLNGDHEFRAGFIQNLSSKVPSNLVHLLYEPLKPLIKDLAAILLIDSHWLPVSDPRKDVFYITEAFQRLILKFIIDNRDKEFINHRVEKTFRKRQETQDSNASSSNHFQSYDATMRWGAIPVGCVCGSMNSC